MQNEALPPPSPPWPLAGTFMVARMLWRSLSWMGLLASAAGAGPDGVVGVAAGDAAVVAEGVVVWG